MVEEFDALGFQSAHHRLHLVEAADQARRAPLFHRSNRVDVHTRPLCKRPLIHAARRSTRFEALEPLRQGVRRHFGAVAKDVARGLAIRHDHGSCYMAYDFQAELAFLGAESSPAFVRAPEGNGCAERFIRTLKENLLWVQSFDTLEVLRHALLAFRETYNTTWLIERLGFQSPAAARQARLSTAALAA